MSEEKKVIIKLENVTYKYKVYQEDGAPAVEERGLNNVSLEIFEGEFLALVGHNGSGKSTLAKLLNGLLLTQTGEVSVDGLNPKVKKELYKIREQVGMVFQNPDNQMIASIVEDDIAFGPENLGVPREEIVERVEGALRAVNMSEFHDKTPTKLSGGQKQRIAIAGVLAIRPRVLVLDEATSMLDPQGRRDVMETVKRLNREGITVVTITHFMDEVTEADRVVVLSDGELVMQGTPQEIFREKDKLREYGLDVPRSVALSNELFKAGLDLSPATTDINELGEELCRLLSDN
ncbi:MAG: energy-coupling factor transporter ATPase [Christensenellales bacterium]